MRRIKRYAYLLGLTDGRIKIGSTKNLRQRLKCHRRNHEIAWVHVFLNPGSGNLELFMKYSLEEIGARIRTTEMFTGITKADAIHTCRVVQLDHLYDKPSRQFSRNAARRHK